MFTIKYRAVSTPFMIFSVTFYSEVHNAITCFTFSVGFYELQMLVFYNVYQTIKLTFVDKNRDL